MRACIVEKTCSVPRRPYIHPQVHLCADYRGLIIRSFDLGRSEKKKIIKNNVKKKKHNKKIVTRQTSLVRGGETRQRLYFYFFFYDLLSLPLRAARSHRVRHKFSFFAFSRGPNTGGFLNLTFCCLFVTITTKKYRTRVRAVDNYSVIIFFSPNAFPWYGGNGGLTAIDGDIGIFKF